ncbi:MAG TPA: winged helix-turn-helix domain-containing protein, partial [Actinoallomurus sp.]|nr:winged helix-turn-helix domain-containing protein [Actinoallomurus sp.]
MGRALVKARFAVADRNGLDAGRGGSGLDLHLELTKDAGGVGRALEAALREAMCSGRLSAGAPLPGSRSLAADLGLSRGTVVQVYAQLAAEGWLIGTPGSGTRVACLPAGSLGEEARGPERGGERARPGLVAGGPA